MPRRKTPIKRKTLPFAHLLEVRSDRKERKDLEFAEHFISSKIELDDEILLRNTGLSCLIFLHAKNYEKAWKAFKTFGVVERTMSREVTRQRFAPGTAESFGAVAAFKTGRRGEFKRLMNIVFEFLPKDAEKIRELNDFFSQHGLSEIIGTEYAIFKAKKANK